MEIIFDLAVIGGGPGGYTAAEKAGNAALSVVLFERRELGGVCLNEGCIPTKTLLYSAKMYDHASQGEKYGVTTEGASIDLGKVFKRKEKVVRKLVGGVKLRMKEAGVEVVKGDAVIAGREGEVFKIVCDGKAEEPFLARNILLCTGSETAIPPIPGLREGLESGAVVTSREMLSSGEKPERLVVIGGGVIGMEFVSFYNSIGTQVVVVEMLPKILGPLDDEVSQMLLTAFGKKGVEFHLGCKVTAIEGSSVVYEDGDGNVCRAEGDKVLVSVGRRPNVRGIGLESIGVAAGRGVEVDSRMRTNVPGVYAAGDVTGFSMLAHTASREAEVAVANILGRDEQMSYDAIPSVVYTNPEVACVGMTEKEAADAAVPYRTVRLPMAYSGRFVAENERGEGICKMVVGDDGKVLGVHLVGNSSSEVIAAAGLAITYSMRVDDFVKTVFPHPTVAEILKETSAAAEKTSR